MSHTAAPALDTDDGIAFVQDTELHGIHEAPLESTVNILLPGSGVEIGFGLIKQERVDAAIEMGILQRKGRLASDEAA